MKCSFCIRVAQVEAELDTRRVETGVMQHCSVIERSVE